MAKKIYAVKLNAWTTPAYVQSSKGKKDAGERALRAYPTCDCCGQPTHIESITLHEGLGPFNQAVLMEVTR
ncbi:MAG TPA: hypothetical protein VN081_04450 [Dongiaceae bacterium]|nr:hypothetical protein [Dongiaceae bacterium]